MFISAFNYLCLMNCSPREMPRCWDVGGLGKLSPFCLTDREFNQSFLCRFLLFPFTKLPILWRNKYVIARAEFKRRPLVRGHHWSPASIEMKITAKKNNLMTNNTGIQRATIKVKGQNRELNYLRKNFHIFFFFFWFPGGISLIIICIHCLPWSNTNDVIDLLS